MERAVRGAVAPALLLATLAQCAPPPPPLADQPPAAAYEFGLPSSPATREVRPMSHLYRGQADGGTLLVALTTITPTAVAVHAEVSGTMCAGSFDGSGTVRGNRIIAGGDPAGPECQFTLVRSGRRLTVQPNTPCLSLSGANCSIAGTATLVR